MKSCISKNINKGFTIVELIVVITLLAILGTIGFVSYVEYISSSRDSSRISQIQIINQAIEGNTRGRAPIPDDKVTIYASGVKIGYQGYAGENVLTEIGVNEGGKDPKDGTYYTYFVDSKQKYAQLLAFLENEEKTLTYKSLINQAKAVDYTERIAKTYGAKLGVLVEMDTKTPVQELSIVKASGLDVVTTTGSYTAYITADKIITGTGKVLQKLQQTMWHKGVGFGAPSECPEGFIRVPGNPDFNQPGFCVMKYEATYEDAVTPDSTNCAINNFNTMHFIMGKTIVSKPGLYSIADITQTDAIIACASIGAGYHLITNDEWMTIARNIESQGTNWSTNVVGSGGIYRGINGEGNSDISLGCASADGNGNGSRTYASRSLNIDTVKWGSTKGNDCDSKRQLQLSNGEVIWDLAGNIWEHVNGANTLNGNGYNTFKGNGCNTSSDGSNSFYYNATTDILPQCGFVNGYTYAGYGPKIVNLNASNGVGRIRSYSSSDTSSDIVIRRGSCEWGVDNVGIFSLDLGARSIDKSCRVGFRCAR